MALTRRLTVAALAIAYGGLAYAGVTAEEAKKLGTTLTAVGAEKAGNTAKTIPEYSGGLTTPPAGFKAGDGIRPDPSANEKPLFAIDAKNRAQYDRRGALARMRWTASGSSTGQHRVGGGLTRLVPQPT